MWSFLCLLLSHTHYIYLIHVICTDDSYCTHKKSFKKKLKNILLKYIFCFHYLGEVDYHNRMVLKIVKKYIYYMIKTHFHIKGMFDL